MYVEEDIVQRPQLLMVTGSMTLAAVLMGASAMARIMPNLGWAVFIIGGCAGLLTYCVARLVLRTKKLRGTVGVGVALTMVAATLNSPFSFIVLHLLGLFDDEGIGLPMAVFFSYLVGLFYTVPLGALFSLFYVTYLGAVFRTCRDSSPEAVDRTARTSGIWLAFVGLGCALSAWHSETLPDDCCGEQNLANLILLGSSLAMLVFGVTAAIVFHKRACARLPWLEQVVQDFE